MSTTTISTPSPVAVRTRPQLSAAWLGFLVVLASAVMDLLDSTIAQTAAPAIQRDLGGSYAALEWITRRLHPRHGRDPAARQPPR